MQLRHIPRDALETEAALWTPFLPLISARTGLTERQLASEAYDGCLDIHIVMADHAPLAIVGSRVEDVYGKRTGVLMWCAGSSAVAWFPLVREMEAWFRGFGCTRIKAVCRPGWSRWLKAEGYAETHRVMEKDL
jgi:hypothetical protein